MNLEIDVKVRAGAFELNLAKKIENSVVGVFGESGAGKTLLLHSIAGLVKPYSGRIALEGRTLFDSEKREFVRPSDRRIGVVFQENRLFPHMTVRGNLEYGKHARPDGRNSLSLAEVAEFFELGELLSRKPAGLSGGESQRASMARTILSGPELILFDEPLASLDHRRRRKMLPFFRRMRDRFKIPMIYVSHDLREILHLTDELLVLERGRELDSGSFIDVVRRGRCAEVFYELGLLNVLGLRVTGGGSEQGFATLASCGAEEGAPSIELRAPFAGAKAGDEVFVEISPFDIALSTERIDHISVQNQLEAQVEDISDAPEYCAVILSAGIRLIACVTRAAVRDLRLEKGSRVWCLVKATAIKYLD
ncbi:MAG: molybdenum ABC transporter ATP-binding protein [Planctomycetes bacterium]|nr:molybdenum ABC transporter ATP-binding protein [Planctomycetota bacterium]